MVIYRQLVELIEAGKPCALATIVGTSGSSPQNAGAKVIFLPDGRIIGTIGGGCLEVEARRIALDCLRSKSCKLFDLKLDDDFGWDDGLICGGQVNIFINPNPERYREAFVGALDAAERREVAGLCTVVRGEELGRTEVVFPGEGHKGLKGHKGLGAPLLEALEGGKERTLELDSGEAVYVEPILPRPALIIAGAGHVGSAVAQIAALSGFEVTVVDDRPSFANRDRLPFADRVVVDDIPSFLRGARKDSGTYIVIVTRGHRNDAQCLRECVGSDVAYLGMIGSKRKIVVIYEELLREELATKEQLLKVHSPLGLSLGDREVGEIAVSIMAELIAVRRGVDPESIRPMQYTPPFLRGTTV